VNRSVLGREGLRKVNSLGLPVQAVPENLLVTTASDSRHLITGLIHLPISVKGRSETLPVLVMPSLNHTLILGVDIFKSFQVSLTIKNDTWLVDVSPPRTPDATTGLTPVNATVDALETPMKVPETMGLVELTPNQKRQTQEIEILYNRVNSNQRLGSTNQIEHVIDTGDAKPFKIRQYPMSPYVLDKLKEELNRMIELGVVEPSYSDWNSPVLVKKSDGTYRFCFDGRKLNSVTKKDSYPLPLVDRILSSLRDARYLSSIDLKRAFWQIPLEKSSREKTAFSVPGCGLYHFRCMPFGLSNAAQTHQRLMDRN
jgi:hypothetical protein